MADAHNEAINFDGLSVAIRRHNSNELYIALQPPDAIPYIVAPRDQKPEEIVAFVEHWIEVIRELRTEMIKRFEKSKSLKCHYRTGDVAYIFGRPFMLRAFPLATSKKKNVNVRVRAKVKATLRSDISVIELQLLKVGDYDQGKSAFLSFAKPVFANNIKGLVGQAMEYVFPDEVVPSNIQSRPMRGNWVKIDRERGIVWFSESLIPYPPECAVYAFLVEMIKLLRPDATEEENHELLDSGLSSWRQVKALLADPDSPFVNQ